MSKLNLFSCIEPSADGACVHLRFEWVCIDASLRDEDGEGALSHYICCRGLAIPCEAVLHACKRIYLSPKPVRQDDRFVTWALMRGIYPVQANTQERIQEEMVFAFREIT